jgi:hypothetical protein
VVERRDAEPFLQPVMHRNNRKQRRKEELEGEGNEGNGPAELRFRQLKITRRRSIILAVSLNRERRPAGHQLETTCEKVRFGLGLDLPSRAKERKNKEDSASAAKHPQR